MGSPHLYFADDRLSAAELAAACLDGHLIALGDAYIPADAVETAALRAGSLLPLLGDSLAASGMSAAWIHGAAPEPPVRHRVHRATSRRLHIVIDRRLDYHDTPIPERDLVRMGGVSVASPLRTLIDLARADTAAEAAAGRALLDAGDTTITEALSWLGEAGPLRGKRTALARVQAWAAQLEVTR